MRRLLRWRVVLPAGALLLIALFTYAAWPGKATYTISPETTYVVGPLDANGRVDYPAALHERRSKGIDPDKNAMVLMVRVIGPRPERTELPGQYYDWLGTTRPPDEGDYFLEARNFIDSVIQPRRPVDGGPRDLPDIDEDDAFVGPPESDESKEGWTKRFTACYQRPWSAEAEPKVAQWLAMNGKPLALVVEASRRPQWYNPMASKSTDPRDARVLGSLIPSVQICRGIANALVARAMMQAQAKDYDAAWTDLQTVQRLGRLVSNGTLAIEHIVGIAVCAIATSAEVTLLDFAAHPPDRLRRWQEEARSLPPVPGITDIIDVGERFMALDAMQAVALGAEAAVKLDPSDRKDAVVMPQPGRPFSVSIDFDPAFVRMNRTYDTMTAMASTKDRAARKAMYAEWESDFLLAEGQAKSNAKGFGRVFQGKKGRGDGIGLITIGLMLPAVNKLADADDRIAQTFRNRDVAIALARYKADTGEYPASLSELAPKYLPTVPDDLFSGKPLTYRIEGSGYLLYSVGANEVDDGGHDRDDLTVRMPVPVPKPRPEE